MRCKANHLIPVRKLSLLLLLSGALFVLHAVEGDALVTASVIRVRETPSLSGKVVMTLARGEKVVVKQISDERTQADGIEAPWAYVTTPNGKAGWAFAGYITNHYQYLNENKTLVAWIHSYVRPKGPSECEVAIYDPAKKKLTRIPVESESCSKFGFSQDQKYLAVDDGTYVYGALHIYRVQDKKLLGTRQYSPREIVWKGNTLEFNELLCDKDSELITEANAFTGGKFQKSFDAVRNTRCAEP